MTRARHRNRAHLVAESVDDARRQWIEVFGRDRADLGPAHAADVAAEDVDRYGTLAQTSASLQRAALARMQSAEKSRPPDAYPSPPEVGRGIGR
jgi:hypothetical protein